MSRPHQAASDPQIRAADQGVKMPLIRLICVVALCCAGGCVSHSYRLDPYPYVDSLPQHKLSGKVLMIDMTGVPEEINQVTSAHEFRVTGIRTHSKNLVKLIFAKENIVDDPSKAEYVLKLTLDLRITSSLLRGLRCLGRAEWTILKGGVAVSAATGEAYTWVPESNIGGVASTCEGSTSKAVSDGLKAAMNRL